MKVKRIISITIAAALAALSAVSVSAAQLTETNRSGNTEVIAHIDVYRSTETLNESTRVNNGDFFTKGYYLTSFNEEGQTLNGTLRFHQKQLYGQNIAEIAGDYSGYMVFFSTIDNV